MTAMTASSSSPRKPGGGLRGPRPQPLKVSSPSRPPAAASKKSAAPVIVYEHTPKVVHARPQEFMTVVQRLTGRQPTPSPALEIGGGAAGVGDPLLLTLGQRRQAQAAGAGLLMSPGFVFSPNTMQYIQELSPLL
ncbi:hypothetical protein BRADI_1g06260v3 [Brachypodium distachyon]|uniref:VQ domain-containing protein n=1 Tax=Brachypodium distachyon TaxID=15368 RepID=A0A0Q3GP90_BRADI|nr:hypothetical protein BRADI_1g06260v3 [Brachypodium distachyon]